MNWKEKANELLDKIRSYTKDDDGWKVAKKTVSLINIIT